MDHELEVINKMGFPGYFLIVADFIRWAKKNDIPVIYCKSGDRKHELAQEYKIKNNERELEFSTEKSSGKG